MNGSVSGNIPDMLEGSLSGFIRATGGGGSTVIVSPETIEDGTLICTITVDGTPYYIYAPTPIEPEEVDVYPILESGTKIATITIGSNDFDIYAPTPSAPTSVVVSPSLQSGTKIGTITVNGTSYDLYAPTPSGAIYNTDEQIIGTYFGKPLYQKCFDNLNISASGGTWINTVNIPNGLDCIEVKCWGHFSEDFLVVPIQSHIDSTNNSLLELFFGNIPQRTIIRMMVQYTKTTD